MKNAHPPKQIWVEIFHRDNEQIRVTLRKFFRKRRKGKPEGGFWGGGKCTRRDGTRETQGVACCWHPQPFLITQGLWCRWSWPCQMFLPDVVGLFHAKGAGAGLWGPSPFPAPGSRLLFPENADAGAELGRKLAIRRWVYKQLNYISCGVFFINFIATIC